MSLLEMPAWLRLFLPPFLNFFLVLTRHFLSSQALSLKEAEKTVLSERVSSLQAELSAAALETERVAREAAHYKEQEQVTGGNVEGFTSSPDLYFVAVVEARMKD